MIKQSGTLTSIALLIPLLCACKSPPIETYEADEVSETVDLSAPAVLSLACSGCHGQETGAIVSLEGRSSEQIRLSLLRYKSDDEGGTVMHRMMRGYSKADIDTISTYLAGTISE